MGETRTGDARVDTIQRAVEILLGSDATDTLFRALQASERGVRYHRDRANKLELEVADHQRSHERSRERFGELHEERRRLLGDGALRGLQGPPGRRAQGLGAHVHVVRVVALRATHGAVRVA